MWLTVVFLSALLGLVALYWMKTLELSRDAQTPLSQVRRMSDHILTEGWAYYSNRFRAVVSAIFRIGALWSRSALHHTESFFNNTVHAVAARLNRYLRTKRINMRHGSEVSAHLKTVLEKSEKHIENKDSI